MPPPSRPRRGRRARSRRTSTSRSSPPTSDWPNRTAGSTSSRPRLSAPCRRSASTWVTVRTMSWPALGRPGGRILLRHPLIGRSEIEGPAGTRAVAPLFGTGNDEILPAVVERGRPFQPDAIVYESLAVAGAVAAASLAVPAVLLENTL